MKQIELTRGKLAIVDDLDYEWLNSFTWIALHGYTHSTWYAAMSGNPWILMHRFIMRCDDGNKVVMHLNDNGLDNRRSNLKVGTDSDNCHLRDREAKGYYWETARQKWYASITIDNKKTLLGRFDREEDAAIAYQIAKQKVLARIFGSDEEAA